MSTTHLYVFERPSVREIAPGTETMLRIPRTSVQFRLHTRPTPTARHQRRTGSPAGNALAMTCAYRKLSIQNGVGPADARLLLLGSRLKDVTRAGVGLPEQTSPEGRSTTGPRPIQSSLQEEFLVAFCKLQCPVVKEPSSACKVCSSECPELRRTCNAFASYAGRIGLAVSRGCHCA
jgi:hypothetical protein